MYINAGGLCICKLEHLGLHDLFGVVAVIVVSIVLLMGIASVFANMLVFQSYWALIVGVR